MIVLFIGMILCVGLAVAVILFVASPSFRDGERVLTPRGEERVEKLRNKVSGAATKAESITSKGVDKAREIRESRREQGADDSQADSPQGPGAPADDAAQPPAATASGGNADARKESSAGAQPAKAPSSGKGGSGPRREPWDTPRASAAKADDEWEQADDFGDTVALPAAETTDKPKLVEPEHDKQPAAEKARPVQDDADDDTRVIDVDKVTARATDLRATDRPATDRPTDPQKTDSAGTTDLREGRPGGLIAGAAAAAGAGVAAAGAFAKRVSPTSGRDADRDAEATAAIKESTADLRVEHREVPAQGTPSQRTPTASAPTAPGSAAPAAPASAAPAAPTTSAPAVPTPAAPAAFERVASTPVELAKQPTAEPRTADLQADKGEQGVVTERSTEPEASAKTAKTDAAPAGSEPPTPAEGETSEKSANGFLERLARPFEHVGADTDRIGPRHVR